MSATAMALAALVGFALGSVPFGLVLLRASGRRDPRTVGSGNIGATNVVRTAGKGFGAATLVLDAGKGVLACLAFGGATPAGALAGVAAVAGHCFTPWLRFRGGKGVATFAGVASVLLWPAGLLAFLGPWLGAFALTRTSSIAGVSGALAVAALATWRAAGARGGPAAGAIAAALGVAALVVIVRHRSNFEKMLAARRDPAPKETDS